MTTTTLAGSNILSSSPEETEEVLISPKIGSSGQGSSMVAALRSARVGSTDKNEPRETLRSGDEDDTEDERIPDAAKGELMEEKIVKSGYLNKKSERRGNWKKRWFVLRPTKLAYYKDEKEYKLIRLIKMADVHSAMNVEMKRHPHAFGVVTQDKTYYLEAPNGRLMDEWLAAMDSILDDLGDIDDAGTLADSEGRRHTLTISPRPRKIALPQRKGSSSGSAAPLSPSLVKTPLSIQATPRGFVSPAIDIPGSQPRQPSSPSQRDYFSSTDIGSYTSSLGKSPSSSISPEMHLMSTSIPGQDAVPTVGMNALGLSDANPTSSEDEYDAVEYEREVKAGGDKQTIAQAGYLHKMGRNKVWKRRYFVLRGSTLAYYKNQEETKPNRVIPLARVVDAIEKDVKGRKHCFKIITPKRVYICAASSEEEELRWLSALQIVLVRNRAAQDAENKA